jgi:hypothetical protein
LDGIARLSLRHPTIVLLAVAALLGLSLWYIRDLPLRSSYLDLLPQDDPLVEEYRELEEELVSTDYMAVLLRLTDPPGDQTAREQDLMAAAARLIGELEHPEIRRATYLVGEDTPVPDELLLFRALPPEDLDRLGELALEVLELLPPLPPAAPPQDLLLGGELAEEVFLDAEGMAQVQAALAALRESHDTLALLERLPELAAPLGEAAEILHRAMGSTPGEAGEPLFSQDRTRLLVQIWPTRPAYEDLTYSRRITDFVQDAIARADLESLGVSASATGAYALVAEGEEVIRRDMSVITLASAIGVIVLLFFAFVRPWPVFAAVAPVVVSALLTMAWAKLSVGGFNLITVFLPALVLGLGIDFSIHLQSRYLEERAEGQPLGAALRVAVQSKGRASLAAALTTAVVFGGLLLARTRALWEMGIIMAPGILIAYLVAMLLAPSLIAMGRMARGRPRQRGWLHRFYGWLLSHRRAVVALWLLFILAMVYPASQVGFRFASVQLAPPTAAQATIEEITREFSGEAISQSGFLFFCDGPEALEAVEEELAHHPLVASTRSARDLLPQELVGARPALLELPLEEVQDAVPILETTLERWDELLGGTQHLVGQLSKLELAAALTGQGELAATLSQGVGELIRLWDSAAAIDPAGLLPLLPALREDLSQIQGFLAGVMDLARLPETELIDAILGYLPEELRATYRTPEGSYLLQAEMLPEIYADDNLRGFMDWVAGLGIEGVRFFALPAVDMQLEAYMRRDFLISTGLAAVLIVLLAWGSLGGLRRALLAMAPLATGYVCMLAGMNLLDLEFNFTNIVISPLLIGIGVDSAIHILHRIEEERGSGATVRGVALTAFPVLVTALTTMVVFGSLLLAHTPGMRFLGASALLGLGGTLAASLVALPAAAAWLEPSPSR